MERIKLILPKGRIQEKVQRLLERTGMAVSGTSRSYRPACADEGIEIKVLKPQNVPEMVALGRHDCGFTGRDWVLEQGSDVIELLDLGFDPVTIVAAVPEEMADSYAKLDRKLVLASEYRKLAMDYIEKKKLDAVFVQAYGATEALPPEDADMIIDNTATGSTLRTNRLAVVDELMKSTTRFICNRDAYENDPGKRARLDEMVMLMKSTLEADKRRLLEMNVPTDKFEALIKDLPCMKAPTVAELQGGQGFAVKIALPAADVCEWIPRLIKAGATDILEYKLEKIVVNGD